MKVIKNLFNNLLHFICKLYGYDLKAEQAKTETMEREAQEEIAEIRAETDRVLEEAAARTAEYYAVDEHHAACHEVYMAILELCKKKGYNMKPANVAHQKQDLEELKLILEAMQNGDYDLDDDVEPIRQPKQPKVKRMTRRAAHA